MASPSSLTFLGDVVLRIKTKTSDNKKNYTFAPGIKQDAPSDGWQHDEQVLNMARLGLFAQIDPSKVTTKPNWLALAIAATHPQPFRTTTLHPPYN